MRYTVLFLAAAATVSACTAILGDDFEVTGSATSTQATGGSSTVGPSSSSATSSVSGGMGGTPGSGGDGGAAGESCTNGVDDDGDSAVDCADDDCMAFACIPAIPTSWTGPLALGEVAHLTPKPSCPGSFASEVYNGVFGLSAAQVTCNTCSCNATNPTCTPAGIAHYTQTGCAGWPFAGSNIVGGCVQMGAFSGNISVRIANPTAQVTCTAMGGGIANTPPIQWDTDSRACRYDGMLGGGCAAQQQCAPLTGGGDFGDRVCIMKPGDEICPAPFTDKTLYSDSANDVVDMRDCTQCGCMQSQASCSVNTQFWNSSNCTSSLTFTIANNNTCNSSNINGLYARAVITGGPTGNCSVSNQAMPQGSVTATGPFTTVCCLP